MTDLSEITEFIVELGEDPERARRFKEAPDAVMNEAGLSEDTKALLKSTPEEFRAFVFTREPFRRPRPGPQTTHVNINTNTNTHVTTFTAVIVL